MQQEYAPLLTPAQPEEAVLSASLRARLGSFLRPLAVALDAQLDARLVRTFLRTVEVILAFRHRQQGLLLSELGAFLLSPQQAPAGTKRLSNLLRSPRWHPALITRFLWQRATARLHELEQAQQEPLLVWDESVLEKPESVKSEGLGSVRSSKAARLTRIKPGFYHPPVTGRIHVPGLRWLGLLLLGPSGPPVVGTMRWWSNRLSSKGAHREPLRLRAALLRFTARGWGRRVLHIWDRGYAGSPWLGQALAANVRFVQRWPKRWNLQDATGALRPAWQHARGKRAWEERWLHDPRRNRLQKYSVLAIPLRHGDYATPLWLVVGRAQGRPEPWYLLTNEPVETAAAAWRIVLAYARRWQIEMTFRYGKSELAMESPRLWKWERRLKLLLLATLAYAFLLSLLDEALELLRAWLLRTYCHRTGKRNRETTTPLYRLRVALSRLWLEHSLPPPNTRGNSSPNAIGDSG